MPAYVTWFSIIVFSGFFLHMKLGYLFKFVYIYWSILLIKLVNVFLYKGGVKASLFGFLVGILVAKTIWLFSLSNNPPLIQMFPISSQILTSQMNCDFAAPVRASLNSWHLALPIMSKVQQAILFSFRRAFNIRLST